MSYSITVDGNVIADDSNDLLIFPVELNKKFGKDADTLNLKIRKENNINDIIEVGKQITATFTINGITKSFSGVIISKNSEFENNKPIIVIECADVSALFNRRYVAESYSAQTIEDIVNDLITKYAADIINTVYTVTTGITLDSIDFRYKTLKDCLKRLCDLSGCIWYVDDSNNLHFDYENNLKNYTTKTIDIVDEYYIKTETNIINRVYIYGGLDANGVRVAAIIEDTYSIAAHGVWEKVILDKDIVTQDQARAIGQEIVKKYSEPIISVEVETFDFDVNIGDVVLVYLVKEDFTKELCIVETNEEIYQTTIKQKIAFETFRKDIISVIETIDERVSTLEQNQIDLSDVFTKYIVLSEKVLVTELLKANKLEYKDYSFLINYSIIDKDTLETGKLNWVEIL